MNRLDIDQNGLILVLLVEGNSISATSRISYVSETTIANVLHRAAAAFSRFHNEIVRNLGLTSIQ